MIVDVDSLRQSYIEALVSLIGRSEYSVDVCDRVERLLDECQNDTRQGELSRSTVLTTGVLAKEVYESEKVAAAENSEMMPSCGIELPSRGPSAAALTALDVSIPADIKYRKHGKCLIAPWCNRAAGHEGQHRASQLQKPDKSVPTGTEEQCYVPTCGKMNRHVGAHNNQRALVSQEAKRETEGVTILPNAASSPDSRMRDLVQTGKRYAHNGDLHSLVADDPLAISSGLPSPDSSADPSLQTEMLLERVTEGSDSLSEAANEEVALAVAENSERSNAVVAQVEHDVSNVKNADSISAYRSTKPPVIVSTTDIRADRTRYCACGGRISADKFGRACDVCHKHYHSFKLGPSVNGIVHESCVCGTEKDTNTWASEARDWVGQKEHNKASKEA